MLLAVFGKRGTAATLVAIALTGRALGSTSLSPSALREANFFFAAVVTTGPGVSGVSQWSGQPGVVIVEVEDVFPSTSPWRAELNQPVTVRLSNPATVAKGRQYYFATHVAFRQQQLAVIDLYHEPLVPETIFDARIIRLTSSSSTNGQREWTALIAVNKAYVNGSANSSLNGRRIVSIAGLQAKPYPGQLEELGARDSTGSVMSVSIVTPTRSDFYNLVTGVLDFQSEMQLQRRCERSADVVDATVISLSNNPASSQIGYPKWWGLPLLGEATVVVNATYNKGALIKGSTVSVWFVQDGDLTWRGAPRLVEGERAALFLRPGEQVGIRGQNGPTLGVYQSGDVVQPPPPTFFCKDSNT